VFLFEPGRPRVPGLGNWYAGTALRAKGLSLRWLNRAGSAVVYAAFLSWVWVPALMVLWLLYRKLRRELVRAWAALHAAPRPLPPAPPTGGEAT